MWIYSSYLGHIDITYSLVTFLQLYALYHFGHKKEWFKAFAISYALAAVGFMMKGLPSVVFQGISIVVVLILNKEFKKIVGYKHLISGLFFLIPIGLYLWIFSQHHDLNSFLTRLFTESSSRTVADKSFLESVGHLVAFPILYLMDIMPWGLSVLIFIRKDARKLVWNNSFLKACIVLFLANIVVYWLSPDYRARYVFMLTPFLLIPSLYATVKLMAIKKRSNIIIAISLFLALITMGLIMVVAKKQGDFFLSDWVFGALVFLVFSGVTYFYGKRHRLPVSYALVFVLIVGRVAYTQGIVPLRVKTGPYLNEKQEARQIAELTKDQPLAMYHSNVSLTMNWYTTIGRQTTLETQTNDHDFNSFYLVPTEVIKDSTNVETYFTFVRRFEQKPFSLVKFKHRFPEMPKKKY